MSADLAAASIFSSIVRQVSGRQIMIIKDDSKRWPDKYEDWSEGWTASQAGITGNRVTVTIGGREYPHLFNSLKAALQHFDLPVSDAIYLMRKLRMAGTLAIKPYRVVYQFAFADAYTAKKVTHKARMADGKAKRPKKEKSTFIAYTSPSTGRAVVDAVMRG